MKMQKIIIDTDMGSDDIMAISMLLLSSRFKILGYILTDGVTKTSAGSRNLQALLDYFMKPATVSIGPERKFATSINFPIMDIARAEQLTLLKGLDINKKSSRTKLKPFDEFIVDALSEPIVLLALGPLTNVANVIESYPELKKRIKRIIMMGGGVNSGNVSPNYPAEYNIALDPPSASKVFKSSIPITMVGIDATNSVPASNDFKERVRALAPTTKEGAVIKSIILNNEGDFTSFYDPLAIAVFIDPGLIERSDKGFIEVVQQGKGIGRTLFQQNQSGNTEAVISCYKEGFYSLVCNLISQE